MPIQSLGHDGYTFAAYPENVRIAVDEAADTWKRFCALPQEIKSQFAITDPQIGVGYEHKDRGRDSQDQKENFDFTIRGNGHLARIAMSLRNSDAQNFIDAAVRLASRNRSYIIEFARQIEATYGIKDFAAIMEHTVPFYRFLHYPSGGNVGDVAAKPHVDHSGMTLHLYESTDGCEYLSPIDKTWKPLPVADGEAVVFGAMQLQLLSDGDIKALCHRVTSNETTCAFGRFAVVCFNMFDGMPVYDRTTHGRLQEMPAGFNYAIYQRDFSQLFR